VKPLMLKLFKNLVVGNPLEQRVLASYLDLQVDVNDEGPPLDINPPGPRALSLNLAARGRSWLRAGH